LTCRKASPNLDTDRPTWTGRPQSGNQNQNIKSQNFVKNVLWVVNEIKGEQVKKSFSLKETLQDSKGFVFFS
jgi:hypothetical protein